MRILSCLMLASLLILGGAPRLRAAANISAAKQPTATVSEVGPNSRTWTINSANLPDRSSDSNQPAAKHAVIELATGMHYWNGTNWEASNPGFEATTNGFSANRTQHKVQLSPDLFVQGAVGVITRDGVVLHSTPAGIGLFDAASGNFLLIGRLTNSVGVQVADNQVVYPNAFDGVCADVVYTMKKGSFHQDVILTGSIDPAAYGFPPATTRIQVVTEFYDPPAPSRKQGVLRREKNQALRNQMAAPDLADETLGFGEFVLGHGRAYLAGTNANTTVPMLGASVGKQFVSVAGRWFLIESVPYESMRVGLQSLPACNQSAVSGLKIQKSGAAYAALPAAPPHLKMASASHDAGTASTNAGFSTPRKAALMRKTSPKTFAANILNARKGFVIDYVATIGSSIDGDYTFQSDRTYFISDSVTCSGTMTLEAGAVLKFANFFDYDSFVIYRGSLQGVLNCQGQQYRPTILTSSDDDSVGESLAMVDPHYTGVPNPEGGTWLYMSTVQSLTNLCLRYASPAIFGIDSVAPSVVWNNLQFVNCGLAYESVAGDGITPINLYNCLIQANTAFVNYADIQPYTLTHCTLDCSDLDGGGDGTYHVTNSILANIGSDSSAYTIDGDFNGFYNTTAFGSDPIVTTSSPFQIVGAGNYYLAGNTLQNQGTTNIDPALLAQLRQKTTASPVVFADQVISSDLILLPQAARDTNANAVDLGYHYDPIDFAMGGVTVSNATVMLTNGATLACFDDSGSGYGLTIGPGAQFLSVGSPVALNHIIAYNNSQEEPGTTNWATPVQALLMPNTSTNAPGSYIYSRFTDWSVMAQETALIRHTNGLSQPLAFQDSQFHGGFLCTSNVTFNFTNCLLERVQCILQAGDGNALQFRNNLCWYGSVSLGALLTNSLLQDNEFYGTAITNAVTNTYISGYNAYYGTSNTFLSQTNTHDLFLTNDPTFQSGLLGNYYQPTNSPLINAGNTTADLVGLYHYTTQVNQTNELDSVVDIGYHYVALDTNGLPMSMSGDGIGDYLKDSNGNGHYDPLVDLGKWRRDSTCGDGVSDFLKYIQGRNLNVCTTVPDTNGIISLQVYTPLK